MTTRHVHARRIVDAIPGAKRAVIAADPIAGIEAMGYTVVAEPALTSKRGAGGLCDGLSFAEHNTVMYAPTVGSKKENFTLLHEVAHILVEKNDDALIWLADRDDPDIELERLCEEVAAALVVPEDLLDDILGTGPLTANDLKTLVARAIASGPACAIAISTRLSSGAVVIIDRASERVIHSSLRGEDLKVYPWKGNEVPSGHPLLDLEPDSPITTKSYWTDTWGRRQDYYLSAVATEKRVYAIFSVLDLWGMDRFHGGQAPPEKSNAPRRAVRCPCGYVGATTGWPCNVCGHQYCPKCGDCDCQRRARGQESCRRCFCMAPAGDLEAGVCSNCR
jgi:Zn-dependent peptidase ImmA (M78 family)